MYNVPRKQICQAIFLIAQLLHMHEYIIRVKIER